MNGRQRSGYSIGTRKAGDLGSTPSECQIFYLFRCVLSSVLPLRSVGRSNFDKGRHNLTTLIHKTDIINELLNYIYIYIYIPKTFTNLLKTFTN